MAGTHITIELGGQSRQLRFDLNALAELEDKLGVGIGEIQTVRASAKTIRAMAWAALLHADASLTEQQVGSWITGDNFVEVTDRIMEALAQAFGSTNGGPRKARRLKERAPSMATHTGPRPPDALGTRSGSSPGTSGATHPAS